MKNRIYKLGSIVIAGWWLLMGLWPAQPGRPQRHDEIGHYETQAMCEQAVREEVESDQVKEIKAGAPKTFFDDLQSVYVGYTCEHVNSLE